MKRKFTVEFDAHRSLKTIELKEYIREAVRMWSKGGDPESRLWDITGIKITSQRKVKKC